MRLAAVGLCLLAAGAGIITGACGLMARGYLVGQADRQLRAYAFSLTSRPFVATPWSGPASGTPVVDAPGGAFSTEVLSSRDQLIMRTGPVTQAGQAIPAVPARVAAQAGHQVTVAAGSGGGSWRVIAEPIHYRARRLLFTYGADDFSLFVTSRARPGLDGTLVVGLDLARISQATGRLAVTGLAVSGAVVLLVACLGAALLRAILGQISQVEQTITAAAAGGLSCRVPGHGRSDAGRLACSVNAMLSQIEHAFSRCAESEAAACRSAEQMCQLVADTGHELRRPISIINGVARHYRHHDRLSADELDRTMRRMTDEADRIGALADDLLLTRNDRPLPPQR